MLRLGMEDQIEVTLKGDDTGWGQQRRVQIPPHVPSLAANKILGIIFLSKVEAIPGARSRAWDASRLFRR